MIWGQIYNYQGIPCPKVKIIITHDQLGQPLLECFTNEEGIYTFYSYGRFKGDIIIIVNNDVTIHHVIKASEKGTAYGLDYSYEALITITDKTIDELRKTMANSNENFWKLNAMLPLRNKMFLQQELKSELKKLSLNDKEIKIIFSNASYKGEKGFGAIYKSPIVYITETGDSYHRYGCQYLKESCKPIPELYCRIKSMPKCSVCKP